jgi:ubiquinone/menaquinone biosynthesis C-methylase UbiE
MKALRDPEHNELGRLLAACRFMGKRVLEIGCGSGKLTWQYAGLTRQVVGIDLLASELQLAGTGKPGSLPGGKFIQADAEKLPLSSRHFDIALFACSL